MYWNNSFYTQPIWALLCRLSCCFVRPPLVPAGYARRLQAPQTVWPVNHLQSSSAAIYTECNRCLEHFSIGPNHTWLLFSYVLPLKVTLAGTVGPGLNLSLDIINSRTMFAEIALLLCVKQYQESLLKPGCSENRGLPHLTSGEAKNFDKVHLTELCRIS